MIRLRIHLAVCDHCGSRIAWSRQRRQWLALNPLTGGVHITRRTTCTSSSGGGLHDPAANLRARGLLWTGGGAR